MNFRKVINIYIKKIKKSFVFRLIFKFREKNLKICLVAGTRSTRDNFWNSAPLGKTMPKWNRFDVEVLYDNQEGLPEIYNKSILKFPDSDIYIFIHDDVWIKDALFLDKIIYALTTDYDVIGVAGNTRISPKQPAWLFKEIKNNQFIWDSEYLSGSVGHGNLRSSTVSEYGPTPRQCALLDGVFLACSGVAIRRKNIRFDERFDFHFYDLDFCRAAEKKGLILGTWPIDLIHESSGAFGTSKWYENYQKYLKKWE